MDLPILHEVLAQSSHKQLVQQHAVADDGGPQLSTTHKNVELRQPKTLEDVELRRPFKPEELYSHLAIDQVI